MNAACVPSGGVTDPTSNYFQRYWGYFKDQYPDWVISSDINSGYGEQRGYTGACATNNGWFSAGSAALAAINPILAGSSLEMVNIKNDNTWTDVGAYCSGENWCPEGWGATGVPGCMQGQSWPQANPVSDIGRRVAFTSVADCKALCAADGTSCKGITYTSDWCMMCTSDRLGWTLDSGWSGSIKNTKTADATVSESYYWSYDICQQFAEVRKSMQSNAVVLATESVGPTACQPRCKDGYFLVDGVTSDIYDQTNRISSLVPNTFLCDYDIYSHEEFKWFVEPECRVVKTCNPTSDCFGGS